MGIITLGITSILIAIFSLYYLVRFSHSKNMPYYSVDVTKDSVLAIGIIGDSWVTRQKLDTILHQDLLERGFTNKIISSGQSGAKSKSIYYNLFKDAGEKFSSKFIIENKPDYCIIVAGVNDAVGQMGSRYYSYHMVKIIKTLLYYDIKPVIVSLPKVGIKEVLNGLNFIKKYRNIISAYFNNNGIVDNIESYRNKLNETLIIENLKNQVVFIDFDSVCESFSVESDLYYNPTHLSQKGNDKFAHLIADVLIKELNNRIH